MYFKVLVFLACLTLKSCHTEDVPKISLRRSYSDDNEPDFRSSGDPKRIVNLISEMTLTNPTKTFYVTLDTLSVSNWLAGDNCESKFCRHASSKLTPSKTGRTVTTDNSQISGVLDTYTDITLGGINLNDLQIISASSVSQIIGKRLTKETDGVFSLSASSLPSVQGVLSLCTRGLYDSGLYLGIPGNLTVNNVYNSSQHFIDLQSSSQWQININYIRNSMGAWKTWCVQGCSALIDSTFIGIAGPADEINSINAFIGTDADGNIECYKINRLQPINFQIGYHQYKIDPKNYILKNGDRYNYKCTSAFMVEKNSRDQWRLGMPMLDQYLTVIDYNVNKIAFMALNSNVLSMQNPYPSH